MRPTGFYMQLLVHSSERDHAAGETECELCSGSIVRILPLSAGVVSVVWLEERRGRDRCVWESARSDGVPSHLLCRRRRALHLQLRLHIHVLGRKVSDKQWVETQEATHGALVFQRLLVQLADLVLHMDEKRLRKTSQRWLTQTLCCTRTRIERLLGPRYCWTRSMGSGSRPTSRICSCSHWTYCSRHSR